MSFVPNTARILFTFMVFASCGLLRAEGIPSGLATFLEQHCYDCHDEDIQKGGLDLAGLSFDLSDSSRFSKWERIFDRVREGEMPPKKKPRPEASEKGAFLAGLRKKLMDADASQKSQFGRVRVRRLTRVEYEHTLHDLLGIDIPLKNLLPEDPVTGGFETVASGQQLSHHHMARYLEAADRALNEAFKRALKGDVEFERFYTPKDQINNRGGGNYRGPELRDGRSIAWPLTIQFYGRLPITRVPASGWYEITLHGVEAINPGKDGAVWGTLRSGACQSNAPMLYPVGTVEATSKPRDLVYRGWIRQNHVLELKPNDGELRRPPNGARGGNVSFRGRNLEKQGYSGIANRGITIKRIYPHADHAAVSRHLFGEAKPADKGAVDKLIARFARRAFRRPVNADRLAIYRELAVASLKDGDPLPEALRIAYRAMLCSPRFLTLPEKPGPLDDHAIAARLSYMLWDSMPDWKLTKLANEGQLTNPEVLDREVIRLLADPKSKRFIESFTDQWLNLRDINFTSPDRRMFRSYDDVVHASLLEETRAFVAEMIAKDLGVRNFIHSDFGMLNGRLVRHYGMDVQTKAGLGLQRVSLGKNSRAGLVTHGSVLKVTANGTTTSPVVRGVWVNERLLGRHIPPPPPDVPAVEPDVRGAVSIRDQLAKHRSSENCNSCHQKIDPAGFALENYDPVGQWRKSYGRGKNAARVDPSGVTPAGEEFADIGGWKRIYYKKPEMLARCFTEQLLTYATGAPMRFSDRDAVSAIVKKAKANDYGVRSIIRAAVASPIFLNK